MGCFVGMFVRGYSQTEIDSLLIRLDNTLADSERYAEIKEAQIRALRTQLWQSADSREESYQYYGQLYDAYSLYRFDSALHYIYARLAFAETAGVEDWISDSRLKLAAVLTSAGLYKESVDHLQTILKDDLPEEQLVPYFHAHKQVYEALRAYTAEDKYAPYYDRLASAYQDSLLEILPPGSDGYLLESGILLLKTGQLEPAEEVYRDFTLHRSQPGTSGYARSAATLALIYGEQGQKSLQKKYRILSAIADIEAAVKENAALTDLAIMLYQEGDITRANRYIEFALADANFYNARQRKIQISQIYPIINGAYQLQIEHQKDTLRKYLLIITIGAVLLVVALLWNYLQMRRLAQARQHLQEANARLQVLNRQLQEANFVKEEYIGHFLNQCSVYLDKLESYQKTVRKHTLAKRMNALLQMTEPEAVTQAELRGFYTSFDSAFLHLYPSFVADFNALLEKDQHIIPKNGELLNTELRIFALIRLGITDSNKIAHFLRYSVNTIYNYRSQIKNKAAGERDQFEREVMRIGAFG